MTSQFTRPRQFGIVPVVQSRTLGKTDVKLSEVSLGTWGLASDAYGRSDERRFEEVVGKALEVGVTTFDLSPMWGDGGSERIVGKAIAGRRDQVQLVTRAGARWRDGELVRSFAKDDLVRDLEGSLERLGVERVDVWLLNAPAESLFRPKKDESAKEPPPSATEKRPDPPSLFVADGIREAIETLKKQGKIRAWGASVSSPAVARMALTAGAQAICLVHNALASEDLPDLVNDITTAGAGVLVRSPLFHGLLAGRWAEYRSFPRGDHRKDRWSSEVLRVRVRQVDRLRFLVKNEVASLAEASLRFVLSSRLVTTAIVGSRTAHQIESAAAAAKGPPYLPADDIVRIPQVLTATP